MININGDDFEWSHGAFPGGEREKGEKAANPK
jgi:hypothetical protein